jgi:hypothetical protein
VTPGEPWFAALEICADYSAFGGTSHKVDTSGKVAPITLNGTPSAPAGDRVPMIWRIRSRRMTGVLAVGLCAALAAAAVGEQPRPVTVEAAASPVDVIDSAVARLQAEQANRPLVPTAIEAVLASPRPLGTKPLSHRTTAGETPALQPALVEAAPHWHEPSQLGRLSPIMVLPADEPPNPAIVRLPPVAADTVSAQGTPIAPSLADRKHPAAVIRLLPTALVPTQPNNLIAAVPNRPPLLARIQPPADVPPAPLPEADSALPPPVERTPLQPAEVLRVPGVEDPAVRVQIYPEDKPIGAVTLNILPKAGALPKNMASGRFDVEVSSWELRPWEETVYFWDAPAFCHRPLYYEEKNLERLGYTHFPHLQPVLSAAHFTIATLGLPYSMTVHPPHECIYPLGHYRPGSPVPFQHNWPEWDVKAAAVQTGVVAGLILLIP